MRKKSRSVFCFFLIKVFILSSAIQVFAAQDILKPLKTTKPPVIDGKLDDAIWSQAPSVTGFKTFIPDFGHDLAEETIAYMAYDSENLYFAFQCFDKEPEKIKASISKRDDIRPDDLVCINLDSFNDQQSLYAFYVNPMGIQMDSRYAGGKEDFSVDMVWHSAGKIHEKGYSVEIQIPLKSIRYSSGSRVKMGIFFERRISRRSEHGSYPALSPEKGYFFLTQMTPMEYFRLKQYTLLEILPAFTYSQKYSTSQGSLLQDEPSRDFSLTGKYGLTPSLIFDATYNPDFSQVEADAGQVDVNLRFDLFYPEKRPFFLEGSENFNLAGSTDEDYLLSVVHTRTIIDPKAGLKLTGKIVRKDNIASIFAADELPSDESSGNRKYAYFSILRYKHALAQDSFIGFFFTDREQGKRYNRIIGPDGQIRLSQSSMLSFHAFGSFSRAPGELSKTYGHALGLDYLYDTRNWQIHLGLQDISNDFQIETGYLTRTGITRARASLFPKFYPRSEILRRVDLILFSSQLKDHSSSLFETENTISLGFLLLRSSRAQLAYSYSTEIFLAQRFNTSSWHIQASSQFTKELFLRIFFREGKSIRYAESPFQGKGKGAQASLVYQPSEKINWTLNFTYSDLFRDSNSEKLFNYTIIRNKLTYQANKYLFFRVIVEHNSYRKQLLTDFLASFTYIPGTVLQLGYGSLYKKIRWEEGEYIDSENFLETRRGLFFKASYLWRF